MNRAKLLNFVVIVVIISLSTQYLMAGSSQGDYFKFSILDNELPSSNVRRVMEDSDGFLWIGTDNGLIRYDGYSYKTIRNSSRESERLTNNTIWALSESSSMVWVGTERGLNRLSKGQHIVTRVTGQPFDENRVESILCESDTLVWVATKEGLYRYNHKRPDQTRIISSQINIKCAIKASSGDIYLASVAGLYRYSPDKDTIYKYPRFKGNSQMFYLFEDRDNNIWIGSATRGLLRLNDNFDDTQKASYTEFKHDEHSGSIACDMIYSIVQNPLNGDLIVGTRSGVSVLTDINDPHSFINQTPESELTNRVYNEINSIDISPSGFVWMASLYNGILMSNIVEEYKSKHYTLDNFASYNIPMISNVAYVNPTTYYLNVWGHSLYKYNPVTRECKLVNDFLKGAKIPHEVSLRGLQYFAEDNELICGSVSYGYYVISLDKEYNPKSVRRVGQVAKMSYFSVQHTTRLRDGSYLLSTNKGLIRDLHKRAKLYVSDLNGVNLFSLTFVDSQDRLWVGSTTGGVFRIDDYLNNAPKNYTQYSKENEGINSNNILSLYEDSRGNIWVTTKDGGLSLYDKMSDRFVPQNENFGILNDMLFSLFESQGQLYMLSETELIMVDLERKTSAAYSSADLFQNTFTSFNTICKISDDNFLLGGTSGFNHFQPDRLNFDHNPPQVAITDIRSKSRSIITDADYVRFDGDGVKLDLPYTMNDVEINFAALNYKNAKQNKYAHRLLGQDDSQWTYTSSRERYAVYNNLKYGKYRLEIVAADNSGVWSSEPVVCHIHIRPPYYRTTTAYVIYLLLLIVILYIIYRVVVWRLQMYSALVKAREQKRQSEELNHLKLKFFTNISHELLTPLSIIKLSADSLPPFRDEANRNVELIVNNCNRLTRLVRQVLEFRKAESANLQLKVCCRDIAKHIEAICNNCNVSLITEKRVELSCELSEPSTFGYFDSDKLDKIMYNLISNAVKYNKENGVVVVKLSRYNRDGCDWVQITVKDSGIGIERSKLKSIFDRFYDGEYRRNGVQGTGIGMSLTKELVDLHHGEISVASKLGVGSKFTVRLPLSMTAYDGAEIDDSRDDVTPVSDGSQGVIPATEIALSPDSKSLLVVEDNSELRSVIVAGLSSMYVVREASNGREGLQVLRENDVDLVVSDVMMPEMDGLQMCSQIKSDIELSHIPVILLTAKASEANQVEGYESGADGYLAKPFSMRILQSRISNIFDARDRLQQRYQSTMDNDQPLAIGEYNELDAQFINKMNQIIESNIGNADFSTVDLGRELNMSKSSFYKKVKAITGLLPLSIINNKRLSVAHKMLEESKIANITEIAFVCGFESARYFSSSFKKRYGYLPSQVRR